MRRKLVWILAVLVVLTTAFGFGFLIGQTYHSPPRPTLPAGEAADDWRDKDLLSTSPAVQDAAARWKVKAGGDLDGRHIQIMQLADRLCIKFAFADLSVGGEPVYCYRTVRDPSGQIRGTTDLLYDGSNVE